METLISHTAVSLRLRSPSLEPDQITMQTGIEPTSAFNKKNADYAGDSRAYWCLEEVFSSSRHAVDALDWAHSVLMDHEKFLKKFSEQGGESILFIAIHSFQSVSGFVVPSHLVMALGKCDMEIHIEFFYSGE